MRLTGLTFQDWDMDQGSEEDQAFIGLPHWECPHPIDVELKGGSGRRTASPPGGCMHITPIFLASCPDSSNVGMSTLQSRPFVLVHGGGLLSFKNMTQTNIKHYTSRKSKSKNRITSMYVSYIWMCHAKLILIKGILTILSITVLYYK